MIDFERALVEIAVAQARALGCTCTPDIALAQAHGITIGTTVTHNQRCRVAMRHARRMN